jgi:hypothetical protein
MWVAYCRWAPSFAYCWRHSPWHRLGEGRFRSPRKAWETSFSDQQLFKSEILSKSFFQTLPKTPKDVTIIDKVCNDPNIPLETVSYASGRRKTCSHQNDIVWTLSDPLSTTFIHFWVIFDLMKSQKFEIKPVIWKGLRTQNQVQMTQYLIFYCIIDQNGLKKSKVTKTAVLWSHCCGSQLVYQSNDLLSTAKFLACWLARIIITRTWSDNGGFLFPTKFSHYDTPRYFQVVHDVT